MPARPKIGDSDVVSRLVDRGSEVRDSLPDMRATNWAGMVML